MTLKDFSKLLQCAKGLCALGFCGNWKHLNFHKQILGDFLLTFYNLSLPNQRNWEVRIRQNKFTTASCKVWWYLHEESKYRWVQRMAGNYSTPKDFLEMEIWWMCFLIVSSFTDFLKREGWPVWLHGGSCCRMWCKAISIWSTPHICNWYVMFSVIGIVCFFGCAMKHDWGMWVLFGYLVEHTP